MCVGTEVITPFLFEDDCIDKICVLHTYVSLTVLTCACTRQLVKAVAFGGSWCKFRKKILHIEFR